MMNDSKAVVMAYHEAFYRNDRAAVRALLADPGEFVGPLNSYTDPDVFLDGAAVFMKVTRKTDLKAVVAEGEDVCLVYDSLLAIPSVPPIPIASWFRVKEGKIKIFHTHFNPMPFIQAKESGDLARALQGPK